MTDSIDANFWTSRYAAGTTPWDLHGVPAALGAFLRRTRPGGTVLIPGCGRGYEVRAFHDAGFEVIAVDFSPAAVEQARVLLGPLAKCVLLDDFFKAKFRAASFDLIYERTFLCSLPPNLWPAYVARIAELLRPGGRLIGMFLFGHESDPPPYPLAEGETSKLFGNRFRLIKSDVVDDSLPIFAGMEKWQEWELVTRN